MESSNTVELDAPAIPHSILILQGRPLTQEQVAIVREQLMESIRENVWPCILNYDGPVYWVPVERKLHEFTEWVVMLREEGSDTTVEQIIEAAEDALGIS